jgi:hypothetical protein
MNVAMGSELVRDKSLSPPAVVGDFRYVVIISKIVYFFT